MFEVDAGTKHLGTTGGSCDRWLICRRIMKVATLYIFIKYCIYVMRIYLYNIYIYIITVDVYIDTYTYRIRYILSGY